MRRRTFFFGAAVALIASSVDAQQAELSQKALFEAFLASDTYRNFANTAFNRIEPAPLRAQCPHLVAGATNLYIPLQEIKITGSGMDHHIVSGAWVSVIDFDRCGTKVRRRAIMKVDDQGAILPIRLLPGDFRGDLTLERDATRIVFPTMMAKAHCQDSKSFYIADVVRKSEAPDGSWVETWTGQGCGQEVMTDVSYAKVPDGVVISADVKR
jgi:hypothetical protein